MNSGRATSGVAVLGGTFDPIHLGHLSVAEDILEKFNLAQVRLMPSYQPVHRGTPSASLEQRLDMLKLAVASRPNLIIDEREITRKGPSYTLRSLKELRDEIGPSTALYFILGIDSFCYFDRWHQWQHLTDYAHLLVAVRPGEHPEFSQNLSDFVNRFEYKAEGYPASPQGSIIFIDNPLIDISSSDIRECIKKGDSLSDLVPLQVAEYLVQHKLYCS